MSTTYAVWLTFDTANRNCRLVDDAGNVLTDYGMLDPSQRVLKFGPLYPRFGKGGSVDLECDRPIVVEGGRP